MAAGFIAACLIGCTALRWLVAQLRPDTPFSLYLPAVLLATVFAGLPGGVAATIAAAALGFLLHLADGPGPETRLVLFAVYLPVAALTVWGISHYRRLVAEGRTTAVRLTEEERYRRLVIDELQHRLRNKVSTIHAVIRQVLRDQPEAWARIDSRIRALSATDDLIARADERGCELGDLLRSELDPYGEGRTMLAGPAVRLPAKLAVCLALVFHELATNAAKYGALSQPDGRLTVSWSASDGRLSVTWDEQGGPAPQAPARSGFGSKLIGAALAGFDGGSEIDFRPDGVQCRLRCRIPPDEALPAL
jgi:two-component sensor histidine kinase